MTLSRIILVVLLPFLVACKLLPEGQDQPPKPKTEQTDLAVDALVNGDAAAAAAKVRPKPRPAPETQGATVEESAAAPSDAEPVAEPAAPKTKAQITCEKQGGNWDDAGKTGAKACFKRTRDAGKQCRKQSNCESVCLARSGTCAPVKPLFGCNEILQDDGRRVTLCVD